jgi:outer membrane immunogenic protein
MKRSWLVPAALLAMITGPAFAADIPLKAPPPVPVASGWNGFYVGAQVGGKWTDNDFNPTCIQLGAPFTCGSALNAVVFPGAPDSNATLSTSGVRYGLYAGWMYQAYDRFVLGAEGDYAFHNKTQTVNGVVGCSTAACTGGAFGAGPFTGDSTSIKNGDDYSFRIRAGFLVMPELQIYGTGGVAAQKVSATITCAPGGAAGCGFPLTSTMSGTLVGWTVGAGIEWKVWDHILVRGEYRYNDYGTWKQFGGIGSGLIEEFANVHVKSQMATFGIAYLFAPPRW